MHSASQDRDAERLVCGACVTVCLTPTSVIEEAERRDAPRPLTHAKTPSAVSRQEQQQTTTRRSGAYGRSAECDGRSPKALIPISVVILDGIGEPIGRAIAPPAYTRKVLKPLRNDRLTLGAPASPLDASRQPRPERAGISLSVVARVVARGNTGAASGERSSARPHRIRIRRRRPGSQMAHVVLARFGDQHNPRSKSPGTRRTDGLVTQPNGGPSRSSKIAWVASRRKPSAWNSFSRYRTLSRTNLRTHALPRK